jgi:signal transduction histidine kinase/HAMP domain-containing protein
LLGLGLGTLLIVNLTWLRGVIREIRDSQRELQRVAVKSVHDQIQLFLEDKVQGMKNQATLFGTPFLESDWEALRPLAHRFLQRELAFEEISIVDRKGKERFRLSRKLVISERELRDFSTSSIFQEGMRQETFWGPVVTTETSEPLVTLTIPLRSSETSADGMVFGVLNLKSLWNLTEETKLSYGGHAYVVDQEGRLIAAGDSSLVLRQLTFADRTLVQQLIHSASSSRLSFVQGFYVNEEEVSVMATGLHLPGPKWAVIVEQPQALLFVPVKRQLWLSLGIFLVGLVASFSLAHFLSHRFTGPITRLREGVDQIGKGRLDHRVTIQTGDEIEALADQFNQMAETLQIRQAQAERAEKQIKLQLEELGALREIGLATASTLDLHNVLNILMKKIDLFLPYAVATVRLLNRKTDELEPVACRNLDEVEWKAATASAGGLGRMIPESNAPVMVRNAQTDPRSLSTEFLRKHGLVSYLRVPLIAKDEVLGVLTFFTREEHEFSADEVEFLTMLAGQAAIAIHNSQLYEQTKTQAIELERANEDLRRREEIQKLIKELSQDITSLDIDTLLKKLTEKVREFFRVDICDVRVREKGVWQPMGISGIDPEGLQSRSTGTARGRSRWVLDNRRTLAIPDVTKAPDIHSGESTRQLGIRGYLGVPLISRDGEVIGILRALSYQPREFNQEEVDLLKQLANGAAIAIENTRLYEAIRNQTAQLEKANKAKDEFLSVMSHELRTPINVVLGYTEMIKDGTLGEINSKQEERLERIISYSRDLLRMINGMLEATRIEAGVAKVESYELNLGDFFDELRLAYEVPLDKELTLIWDYPTDLPVIRTDSEKLKHILQNLINNAIKFTDKGNVTISARCLIEAKAVQFKVADTGVGIPKESLPIIFEMFRQVDSSARRRYAGVGIGLYIVKKFTELLGGKVEVESEVGKGSTFTVTIPCEMYSSMVGQQTHSAENREPNA